MHDQTIPSNGRMYALDLGAEAPPRLVWAGATKTAARHFYAPESLVRRATAADVFRALIAGGTVEHRQTKRKRGTPVAVTPLDELGKLPDDLPPAEPSDGQTHSVYP